MIFLGLDRNSLDIHPLFLEKSSRAGDRSASAATRKKVSYVAAGLFPDFRAGAFIMCEKVSVIFILVWHVVDVRPWFLKCLSKGDTLVCARTYSWTQIV